MSQSPTSNPNGLTEAERRELIAAWPWPKEAATTKDGFDAVVAAAERILEARLIDARNGSRADLGAALSRFIAGEQSQGFVERAGALRSLYQWNLGAHYVIGGQR